ncbi:MAG: hypothetical protein AB7T63_14390 [Planctomycetota bacterium]
MRAVLLVAVTLAAAGGLWLAFRGSIEPSPELTSPDEADPAVVEDPAREAAMRATVGTLAVRVRTEGGEVPPGAEVGYEALHRTTWVPAGRDGVRTFTNVPVGIVHALARAPGYETARQRRDLPPGLADEALLVLRRAPGSTPPPR